jgi:hypothetical protein
MVLLTAHFVQTFIARILKYVATALRREEHRGVEIDVHGTITEHIVVQANMMDGFI